MSAFVCDDRHISALALYAAQVAHVSPPPARTKAEERLSDAERIARLLHAENVKSVNSRYRESAEPPFAFEVGLLLKLPQATPVAMIKAAHCYEYQACEHEGWNTSYAKRVIACIISHAEHQLPGYEAAAWGSPL